jgi:hypothetical protein
MLAHSYDPRPRLLAGTPSEVTGDRPRLPEPSPPP